ncbi:hypothetical protein PBY51_024898 [Eleginops maclovinus]|uniref:Secreted protein n=1 Tax=Eleginops maclovinus TaxID=56733 RepID=A0AAN7XXH6_ELEMC|nr:hypothetical protein PBY51_024898 [Eleginops maclovinus]
MAGCLHRCTATFTCQLLVEVVSSLMTPGADSEGSACLLSLPHCLFVHPPSQLSKSRFSSTRGNEHCMETQAVA